MVATIRHERAYFNAACAANIPESWTVYPEGEECAYPCADLADTRSLAENFGYKVTLVIGPQGREPAP